jgi:hypothetical protein
MKETISEAETLIRQLREVAATSGSVTLTTVMAGGFIGVWLVFASGDANTTYQAATDTLLKLGNPPGGVVAIKTNAASDVNLEYNPDGTTNEAGATARFTVCDDRA